MAPQSIATPQAERMDRKGMGTIRRRRHRREDHFTQIANDAARDVRLSRAARGLLVELLSHADGWATSERQLAEVGLEGRHAVRMMLLELEEHGYLSRPQGRAERGKFGVGDWLIDDEPAPTVVRKSDHGQPWFDFPTSDNPTSDNPTTKKNKNQEDDDKETASATNFGDLVVVAMPIADARRAARDNLRAAKAAGTRPPVGRVLRDR